jgi:hypothetical protein
VNGNIERIDELENSLSIALENVEKYQRDHNKLKKRVEEAEGENTIIKGIGLNSPEMKALRKENEELKAGLAREKEDHQYDNLVHENELKSLKSKKHRMNQK